MRASFQCTHHGEIFRIAETVCFEAWRLVASLETIAESDVLVHRCHEPGVGSPAFRTSARIASAASLGPGLPTPSCQGPRRGCSIVY